MRYVPPAELHSVWSAVKAGLEDVKAKCPQPWIPEDVYSAIKAGISELHFDPEGFAVLTPSADPFSGERYLLIWIAYASGGDGADGEAYVFALAKRAGFQKGKDVQPPSRFRAVRLEHSQHRI